MGKRPIQSRQLKMKRKRETHAKQSKQNCTLFIGAVVVVAALMLFNKLITNVHQTKTKTKANIIIK